MIPVSGRGITTGITISACVSWQIGTFDIVIPNHAISTIGKTTFSTDIRRE
jgi:hypothetical protein